MINTYIDVIYVIWVASSTVANRLIILLGKYSLTLNTNSLDNISVAYELRHERLPNYQH